jgi:hypothetical protein
MKNLIKSKTFWTGAGSIVTGIGFIIVGNKPEGLQLVFSGFGMIFLRRAVSKNAA